MNNEGKKTPLRLLLVEDSPSDAALFQENILSRGQRDFFVNAVPSLQKAIDHLKNNPIDAVLLDLNLPDSMGLDTVKQARQAFPDVPIIVLTGVDDEKIGIESMQAGVQDYLVKGQADGRTITRAVRYAIERKRAELALGESEKRLKAIAETTPVGISVTSVPGAKFLYFNNAYLKSFGYTEAELLEKNAPDIYWNVEDRTRLLGVLKERGSVAEYEIKLKRKDGTWFWGLSSLEPITYAGMPALLIAVIDITERKNAEDAVRKLSQELERKVEARTAELKGTNELLRLEIIERVKAEESLAKRQQVLESIYAIETGSSVSLQDVFDQIAQTIADLVNLPYTAVGRIEKGRITALSQLTDNSFSHDKSIPVTAHPCGIVVRDNKTRQYSGNLRDLFPENMKAAGQDYRSYVGIPVFDKEGVAIGVICAMGPAERSCSDLELHTMEIFARYLGHEIEHEIMDDQLRIAGEMNLLGRIASGVAHEVRNPLNGILAISEALFQDLGDRPEHLPYLHHIKTQVNRLSSLMKDLLDLGKPLKRSEFTPQPLAQIIRSAIDSLNNSTSHKGRIVNFMPVSEADFFQVKGDAVKLQQVFFNIIDNACDHSPASEPLTVELTGSSQIEAVVRVIDKGQGIAPDLLEKVFEPFFTTRKGGTGLGLSIVKRIVELHDGTVSIANNDPGPGLTVEVRLPFCAKQEQTAT